MRQQKYIKGGEFLIRSISPQEIFTPEDFTEEHRLIAKATTEFVAGEVLPVADDIEEKKEGLVPSLLRKAGELGFLSGDIAEEYGGQELDKASVILLMENLSRGGGSFMAAYSVHTGPGSLPIVFFGNQDQKIRYLPKLATGEFIGAYALTEPQAGSDALNAKTTATLSPDRRYYILNGQKQFITNAGIADTFVTYAKVNGEKFTAFIVEKAFEGVSLDEEENKMGMKGSSTRSVIFTNVKVPGGESTRRDWQRPYRGFKRPEYCPFHLGCGLSGWIEESPAGSGHVCETEGSVRQADCRIRSDQTEDRRDGDSNVYHGEHDLPHRRPNRSDSPTYRPPC